MIRFASAKIKEVIKPDSQGNIRTAKKMVAPIDPDYLYTVVSGLHGDEPNQNGDYFGWDELLKEHHQLKGKKVYATWVTKPNLVNHDGMRVVGEVIDAWPIEQEKSIDMLVKVARKHDWLVRPIERGEIQDVSMGCSVAWSRCSECNHIAHDESEWCEHLSPNRLALKGRTNPASGKFVYEDNRDVTGVELSWITFGEGADAKAEKRYILASKENDMLDDRELDEVAGGSAPKGSSSEKPGKPVVAYEHKGSLKPFSSANGGAEPVVGGSGASTAGADAMLGGLVASLVNACKLESQLGGNMTPAGIMTAFDNGDLSKKDMVHLAAKLGLGMGLDPKAAYDAIRKAAVPPTNSAPTPGDVYVEVQAGGRELLVLEVKPGRATIQDNNGQTFDVSFEELQDYRKYRKLGRRREVDVTAAKVVAQAVQSPESSEKPESAATEQAEVDKSKKHMSVTDDEEKKDMSKAKETEDLLTNLKNLVAVLSKQAAGEQKLEDGLENAKSPVTPAKPDSLKSPNPEIKDEKALEKTLDKGQEQVKDKVDRIPEDEEIKTIDSGNKKVEKLDQDPLAQPDPNPGEASKNPNIPKGEELKTMKGVDGLDSKTEMPKSSALSVDLVDDAKAPTKSYWKVSVGDEPVFAVTAEKAFGNSLTPAKLYQFKSAAYGNELRRAIRSKGLTKTLTEYFGGGKGAVVIAKANRLAQLDMGLLPKMPNKEDKKISDLPEIPGDQPEEITDKPPMMNIDKQVAEDIEEGGKKGKSPFVDMLVDLIAPVIVKDDKWTLDDVINELGKMAKGDSTLNIFQGKLEKKIEELRSKKGDKGEKKEEKEEKHEEKESDKEEKQEEHEKSESPAKEAKEEAKSEKELKLEAALKELTSLLPAVAARLQKGEEAEVARHDKIRAVQTRKLAVRMASLNMIEQDGIDAYAAALAKKSDSEVAAVAEMVERAEAALPRIEAARVAKVGEKVAELTKGAAIHTTIPGGRLDRTSEELSASGDRQPLVSWSRPPKVDESQRKA